ncbi:MAG: ABC-F family ATP-binding cassette domain-containing protein [Marinilabiliales bacterium]
MIPYLQAENISKSFGDLVLFEDISLSVHKDQKIALIARNGTGKSTLLQILAGNDTPDSGKIIIKNDISIGYLMQNPVFNEQNTVLEEAFNSSNEIVNLIKSYNNAIKTGNKEQQAYYIAEMDRLGAWDYDVRAKQILSELNIENHYVKIASLSGGEKKRVALANVLINKPDVLILDEPTNHLDLNMIEWLEDYLIQSKTTLLMVTHDRYFLDRVCSDIFELDEKKLFHYKGNYSYFLKKREERIQLHNAEVDKARNLLRKELDWISRMPKARGTKAKYRVENFFKLEEKASNKKYEESIKINVKTSRLGKKILSINYLNKSFGVKTLIKDFTYSFSHNEKIGVVGKNGTGKTTLLNIITGNIKPDSGNLEIGETVVFGYYKQEGIKFKENQRVIDIVKDIAEVVTLADGKKFSVSQFLQYFLFTPDMQYTRVEKLSGGEKRRLYLMTVLMKNPNFLILDEPTNDLDIITLNVLEDYLINFQGCVLIVSHDRYFMDKIVNHIFSFEGNGVIKDFPGNYTQYREYLKNKSKLKVNKTQQPKQIKEKNQGDYTNRLSYKEKYEMQQIEAELEMLYNEKETLEKELNSGQIDHKDLSEKTGRLGKIIEEIDNKELRWLELSEKDK